MVLSMDERKRRILRAIIDDHIQTAAPVGSRTISRKYGMDLSSATIRNEMSDLEELGYLEQPHISAGRVPNAKAYRLYVDFLLESGPSEDDISQQAREYFLANIKQLEDIVGSTAQILSEFTRYVSVVLMPRREALRIRSLHLLPISRASALLVIVTDGGIVRDTLVNISDTLDAEALYAISRMLTERFRMKSLGEAQEMLREYAAQSEADPRVLQGIMALAAQIDCQASSDNLQVSGSHNILNYPEYYDVDRARNLLSVLEEKERLTELMRSQAHQAYSVHIGPETGIREMDCCSVIMASYQAGHGRNGSIGIIGPTRMPYATILSTLAAVGGALSDILSAENAPL